MNTHHAASSSHSVSRDKANHVRSVNGLVKENRRYLCSGGRSEENREEGFRPAFLDAATHTIHPSRFGDGRDAPVHVLDGLPEELVISRSPSGQVTAVSEDVVSGFVRKGRFYSRRQAAASLNTLHQMSSEATAFLTEVHGAHQTSNG